jgi:hypothetical protein
MVTRGGHVARRCFLSIVHRSKEVGRLRVLLQRAGRVAQEGGFENVGSGLPIWIGARKMNSDTPVTDAAFETFLHCETKAYLLQRVSTVNRSLESGRKVSANYSSNLSRNG